MVKNNLTEHAGGWDYFNWAQGVDLEEPAAEHLLQAAGKTEQGKVWLQGGYWWKRVGSEESGVEIQKPKLQNEKQGHLSKIENGFIDPGFTTAQKYLKNLDWQLVAKRIEKKE